MATPEPYSDNYLDDVKPPGGFFDQFRHGAAPTLYPSHRTPVTADVLEAGWIFAVVILAFSLLLILPGVRRWQRKLMTAIRILVAVGFLAFIMLCNFGQNWEVAKLSGVKTQYKAGVRGEIKASLGVHIGLRSVNITLKGEPTVQSFEGGRINETIDYNERFSWNNLGWLLGRRGFGPYAGRYNQEFREGQRRGLPYPILIVAEYFTFDGEGLRWGRYYMQAGYFTHIMIWTALPAWIIALILFNMVPRYGGYFSMLTGGVLLIGNIIYGSFRNPNRLHIAFYYEGCTSERDSGDNRDCYMKFHFDWCFWLCLFTGICCFLIGVAVVVLDVVSPDRLDEFFNVDVTQDLEEFVVSDQSELEDRKKFARHRTVTSRLYGSRSPTDAGPSALTEPVGVDDNEMQTHQPSDRHEISSFHAFRKRTIVGLSRAQKPRKTDVRPESQYPPDYEVSYVNTARAADTSDSETDYETVNRRDSTI